MYIYIIYIYSFIYNIFRRLLPTVPSVVISLRFPWSFMWSSNFRHGLLKSLLSKYTLFSILYLHPILSFPTLVSNTSVRASPNECVFPPSVLEISTQHYKILLTRTLYALSHRSLAIVLTKMTGIPLEKWSQRGSGDTIRRDSSSRQTL